MDAPETDAEIAKVLLDPAASDWLKTALSTGLQRDPVDAANDAEYLSKLLRDRVVEMARRSVGHCTDSPSRP